MRLSVKRRLIGSHAGKEGAWPREEGGLGDGSDWSLLRKNWGVVKEAWIRLISLVKGFLGSGFRRKSPGITSTLSVDNIVG